MPENDPHRLLELTTDIISSHIANNAVATADLPQVIVAVHARLAELGQPRVPPEKQQKPAVPIKKSVAKDKVFCLECGRSMKMLKRHLRTDHDLGPAEYRMKWGLGPEHPLVAPDYSEKRQALAKKIGLGQKPGKPKRSQRRSK